MKKLLHLSLILLLFSCSNDNHDFKEPDKVFTVEKAKEWYGINTKTNPVFIFNASTKISLFPVWEKAKYYSNETLESVEVPYVSDVPSEYDFKFLGVPYYAKLGSSLDNENYFKLIILKNISTGEITSFTMVTYSDISKNVPIGESNYLQPSAYLNGLVFLYNSKSEFYYGWEYVHGELINVLGRNINNKSNLKSSSNYTSILGRCYETVDGEKWGESTIQIAIKEVAPSNCDSGSGGGSGSGSGSGSGGGVGGGVGTGSGSGSGVGPSLPIEISTKYQVLEGKCMKVVKYYVNETVWENNKWVVKKTQKEEFLSAPEEKCKNSNTGGSGSGNTGSGNTGDDGRNPNGPGWIGIVD